MIRTAIVLVLAGGALAATGFGVLACSSESAGAPSPTDDGGAEDAGQDSGSYCSLTRAYAESCGRAADLLCAESFDVWCAKNDEAVNSDAFRRAAAKCLLPANCDPDTRKSCEYVHYGTETPTAAQTALVDAYCATCEPGVADCKTRSVTYDPKAGPSAVPDIFIAAWELNDALTDEIKTKCTGSSFDARAVSGGCTKSFASCAGEAYLNRVPDCP